MVGLPIIIIIIIMFNTQCTMHDFLVIELADPEFDQFRITCSS